MFSFFLALSALRRDISNPPATYCKLNVQQNDKFVFVETKIPLGNLAPKYIMKGDVLSLFFYNGNHYSNSSQVPISVTIQINDEKIILGESMWVREYGLELRTRSSFVGRGDSVVFTFQLNPSSSLSFEEDRKLLTDLLSRLSCSGEQIIPTG